MSLAESSYLNNPGNWRMDNTANLSEHLQLNNDEVFREALRIFLDELRLEEGVKVAIFLSTLFTKHYKDVVRQRL